MLEDQPASPTIRLTAWLIAAIVVLILVGSSVAKTEIVARGRGRIVPTSRVQIVQPRTDGKVVAILVHEGDFVHAGELLLQLDPSAAKSDIRRIRTSIDQQQVKAIVARAIIEALTTTDPADSRFIEVGQAAFESDRTAPIAHDPQAEALVVAALVSLRDQATGIDAQLARLVASRKSQNAKIREAIDDRKIVDRYLDSAKTLKERGTMSRFDYLQRVRDMNAAKSAADVAEHGLDELTAQEREATSRRAALISNVLADRREQLNDASLALDGLDGELDAAETRLADLSLTSPVDGRIEDLQIFTLGGFVKAGATLMSIVPSGLDLEIEALFDNRDIGFLKTGQRAFVKFDAFPAERYGMLHARVIGIGANARQTGQDGDWAFSVRLAPETSSIRVGNRLIEFSPGMTATVDVVTGERRLISYFFAPMMKAIQDGLGER